MYLSSADHWGLLMRAVAERRDRAAFTEIFDHYTPRLEAYLHRLGLDAGLAEEIAQDVMVTLNPPVPPRADKTIQVIEYAHPLLDTAAYAAQQALPSIQGLDRVYFCGAWTGYGFHEDGLKAGMAVARLLGVNAPWDEAAA